MKLRITILPLAIIPVSILIGRALYDVTTESGIIDALVSGGPVAILAFIIWMQSRSDMKTSKEQWQTTCQELVSLKKDDIKSRDENTKALQKLSDVVQNAAIRNLPVDTPISQLSASQLDVIRNRRG